MQAGNWIALAGIILTATMAILTLIINIRKHRDEVQRKERLLEIEHAHIPHLEFNLGCNFYGPQQAKSKMPATKNLFWRCIFLALAILLFFWINLSKATNYYVAKNHSSANDANPGTLNAPWKTIQHAAETLQPGDTVFIRSGNYSEPVSTTRSGSGINGAIVFAAFPGEKPAIDGSIVSSGRTGFGIAHSFITLIGLEICNWETGIWMELGSHIELADCEVHHCVFGIGAANGAHDFVLNRVEIHHFDLDGFDASPSGGADCYNGTLNDCAAHTARDRQQNVDGFALGHGTQHDFVFNRCTTYDVFDGFDISARNTTLNRCLAYDCMNGAYKLWQDQIKLVNCIGYNSAVANVEIDWDEKPGRTLLINCTFFDAKVFTIWVENSADTLSMYNCILAGGDNIGLAFEQMGVGNYHGDYNIFHNDESSRGIAIAYTDEFTLDQIRAGGWTNYSGQDGHSLVVNSAESLFVNPTKLDFHLLRSSPAIDRGTSVSAPSEDYEGNPRPKGTGYDIGAYEYQFPTEVSNNNTRQCLPELITLDQNYPNPFNAETSIGYTLPQASEVEINIFNIYGQEVATLVAGNRVAGSHKITWNGKDDAGHLVASGVYLYSLKANQIVKTRKLLLIR